MKLHIAVEFRQYDNDGPKGDELDEAVEQAVEEIDIDGWEVAKVRVEREKPRQVGPIEEMLRCMRSLHATDILEPGDRVQLDDKYPPNPTYTWREMLGYWAEEIEKMTKTKGGK